MVIVYFDIETHSPGVEPSFDDKVILICMRVNGDTLLREWESSEEDILSDFYWNYLMRWIKKETTIFIGWNITRFDIPVLTYRLYVHKIDNLKNILEAFRIAYWMDLRQCLLPFNRFRFKGLGEEKVAEKLKIRKPVHSNKDIRTFYETRNFKAIEEHILSEMVFLSDLFRKLKNTQEIVGEWAGLP